jgi:CubicO group peptidase (beta-lactamase class C family)
MKFRSILLAVLCFHAAHGQSISEKKYAKAILTATDSITRLMKNKSIPGLSVTVCVDGKMVWSQGFGFADLEQRVVVNPSQSRFRIGSISKSLTAGALGKLYEQKKIILDSSIYYYVPDFPRKRYRPTIRQISGHLGGVRHYKGQEFLSSKHYNTVREGLSLFENDSLLFKPGTQFQYSSHGFNLLSAAMEKASGKNFLTLMQESVFDPLGMKNTSADVNDSIIDHRTRFYQREGKGWSNAPYVDNSYKWAGGGFISTSEDIARYANALLRGDFLKKETITLFTTSQKLPDKKPTWYGIGFGAEVDPKGIPFFGHSGGSVGGTTDMVIYPDKKITVVVLTNLSSASLGEISNRIAYLFMEQK